MRHCVYNMPAGDAALDSRVRGGGGAALEVSSCHPGLPLADESATFVSLSANRKQALHAHLTNGEKAGDGLALSAKAFFPGQLIVNYRDALQTHLRRVEKYTSCVSPSKLLTCDFVPKEILILIRKFALD